MPGWLWNGQAEHVLEPQEIVAELHRQIAAKSSGRATLVAAFEALRRAVPGEGRETGGLASGKLTSAACRERMRHYLGLRAAGLSRAQAAARMGIHVKTAQRYDSERYLAGGTP
jgi:hypothetical protein